MGPGRPAVPPGYKHLVGEICSAETNTQHLVSPKLWGSGKFPYFAKGAAIGASQRPNHKGRPTWTLFNPPVIVKGTVEVSAEEF